MNKRIQELANQVGLSVKNDGIVLTKNVNAAEAFEQFSELIIRELIDEAESYGLGVDAVEELKKDFGVEE